MASSDIPSNPETLVPTKQSGPRKTAPDDIPIQTLVVVAKSSPVYAFFYKNLEGIEISEPIPRMKHVRTTSPAIAYLPQTNVIVIAGGTNPAPLSSAETFNFKTWEWSVQPSMTATRFATAGVCLPDGITFLVCGGIGELNGERRANLSSCEQFNSQTCTWSPVADMSGTRHHHSMVLYRGIPVVLGGTTTSRTNTAEQYDIVTNTWSTFPPFRDVRCAFGASVIFDKIYIAGGFGTGLTEFTGVELDSVEVYDGASWSVIPSVLPSGPRFDHTIVCFNNKLLVIGGGCSCVDAYDPITETWSDTLFFPRIKLFNCYAVVF